MSNKYEITEQEKVTLQTVNDLTQLANDTIKAYTKTHPTYNKIIDKILDTFGDEEFINSLDNEELLKVLTLASKNQLAPIEQLTKLVTQLNALQERLDASKDLNQLKSVVDELVKKSNREDVVDVEVKELEVDYAEFNDKELDSDEDIEDTDEYSGYNEYIEDTEEEPKGISLDDLMKNLGN